MLFLIVSFVIAQRLIELHLARLNETTLLARGAYEVGSNHYPFMLAMHSGFFISLLLESYFGQLTSSSFIVPLFLIFIAIQIIRIWCLRSLGPFWNTKIIILPGATIVKKGPYRYMKHPNYLVVTLEIILLPLMFQAYITAAIFTLLNMAMLSVRIPMEEKALREATNYDSKFPQD